MTDSVCVWTPETVVSTFPLSSPLQLSDLLSIRISGQSSCVWLITLRTLNHYSKHTYLAAQHSCFTLTVTQHVCVCICACISKSMHSLVSYTSVSFCCKSLHMHTSVLTCQQTLLSTTDVNTNTHTHYIDYSLHLLQMVYPAEET